MNAKILSAPPLILPSRVFVYPHAVPGEEDAMARGSIWVEVSPTGGGNFLAQCAIGYKGGDVATGLYPSPKPDELCIAAGGYLYRVDTQQPQNVTQVAMRPVVRVLEAPDAVVCAGFHTLLILTADGEWETPRLSHEGLTELRVEGDIVHGLGWDVRSDREIPFTVHLATRETRGGAFNLP